MRLRIGWLTVMWAVIVVLSVLIFLNFTDSTRDWIEALLFLLPAILATIACYATFSTFSKKNPERKTWKLIVIGASSLVIAEIFRGLIHLVPAFGNSTLISYLPYLFILVCFIFLIWGFWHQQMIIETTIGKNIQYLLLVIVIVFGIILFFGFVNPVLQSDRNAVSKGFMLIFLLGDLMMFSGALAISFRVWGGRLAKPWLVWSAGTIVLIGYHMYTSYLLISNNDILSTYTGVILAIALGIMSTACELRRSLLE